MALIWQFSLLMGKNGLLVDLIQKEKENALASPL
jgi:hypothetical protein